MSTIAAIPATLTSLPNRVICGAIDPDIAWAMDRAPQPWFFEVLCHGDSETCLPAPIIDDKPVAVCVEDLGAFIASQPGFHHQPVRLLMCWVGAEPNGFAQQLANLLRVPVIAPPCAIYDESLQCETPGSRYLTFFPEPLPREE